MLTKLTFLFTFFDLKCPLQVPEVKTASVTPGIHMAMHAKNQMLNLVVINAQSCRGTPVASPELYAYDLRYGKL